MDNLDMDISNYSYEDLLNLFHLHSDFSGQELKSAKTIVYKVHPDKSGLDKSYFLFFSKAYKMLYRIYQFREGSSKQHTDDDEYTIISKDESTTSNRKILEQHKEYAEIKKNAKAFNSWFNELFEKNVENKNKDEDGYGTWLSSEMDNVQKAKNPTEMAEMIEDRKKKARDKQLIIYNSFEPIQSTSGDSLIKKEGPSHYQSGLFSKLQYDDLKDAHENSVIPVTYEDYKNRKTFRNIDEMNRQRKMDEIGANEVLQDHNLIMKKMENEAKEENISRFYDLMKQEEEQKKRNHSTWSQLKRLN